MQLEGIASDQLPDVLTTGRGDVGYAFVSLSAREPGGRDADYIAWHSLDHRPEQYRLARLRHSIRLVSTPECRAARAASVDAFDAVDHVMTYMFVDEEGLPNFGDLGGALDRAGRMLLRLPSVGYMTGTLAGKVAAVDAVAGADVIPWRPALGVYLIVEHGQACPAELVDVPGVAGLWWFDGALAPSPYDGDSRGRRMTYCFLDQDPVAVATTLHDLVRQRWASGDIRGLLAAPFFSVVPFEWARHLP